jgi:hypothetical protein
MQGVRGSEHVPAPTPQDHMMQASDGDPDHTNGCATTRRPNPQHNMVYVTCENLVAYGVSVIDHVSNTHTSRRAEWYGVHLFIQCCIQTSGGEIQLLVEQRRTIGVSRIIVRDDIPGSRNLGSRDYD